MDEDNDKENVPANKPSLKSRPRKSLLQGLLEGTSPPHLDKNRTLQPQMQLQVEQIHTDQVGPCFIIFIEI